MGFAYSGDVRGVAVMTTIACQCRHCQRGTVMCPQCQGETIPFYTCERCEGAGVLDCPRCHGSGANVFKEYQCLFGMKRKRYEYEEECYE